MNLAVPMRFAAALPMLLCLMLAACQREPSDDAPKPAFQARVGGDLYWVQHPVNCGLNHFNNDESPQWLFSFEHLDGQSVLHLGLSVGDDRPGPRDVTFVLLNHGDASYSEIREQRAELTSMQKTPEGWRMSGRFELTLAGSSMASGRPETHEIRVESAEFRNIDCRAPPTPPPTSS